jgi:PHO85 cyclin-5
MGDGVQGEPDLSGKIVQGNIDAEEWQALSLDSVMADFIHMDAAVDANATEMDTMATVKVVDSDEEPQSASSFTSQLLVSLSSKFIFNSLKLHLVQNLVKKPKVPSGPLPSLVPLPLPLLCPHCIFLVSLILASKFMQDWCYFNKAWAKLSGLPPCEIGRCEGTLWDALEWCLWVGKTLADSLVAMSSVNCTVVRSTSKSDGELFISTTIQCDHGDIPRFSTLPLWNIPPGSKGAGLQQLSTVSSSGFSQDLLMPGFGATSMDAIRSFHFGLVE